MTTVEERLAYVEGRVAEQGQWFAGLRDTLSTFEGRVDARFEHIDRRFEQMDRRFEQIDRRFEQMDGRLDRIRSEMVVNFRWIVGLQVTTLAAVVGTLIGALAIG